MSEMLVLVPQHLRPLVCSGGLKEAVTWLIETQAHKNHHCQRLFNGAGMCWPHFALGQGILKNCCRSPSNLSILKVVSLNRALSWVRVGFSHDAEKPQPGDELISYLCNSNNPFHGIGSNELFLAEDEDATQFDFYGTIFHASVMAEARQFRRRQQLTRSNLADAVDDDNKHRISPSCTSNGAYIRWHLSFCQRCAFCTGA